LDRLGDTRPDIDQARSVSRRLRRIFEPGGEIAGTLEEAQRLCEAGRVALDDPYCRSVMRAISACAEYCYRAQRDDASPRPLIQSLLTAFEGRLEELERFVEVPDTHPGRRHLDRRRAQRRNYLLRPTVGAMRRPDQRTARR
jgi:hypothetical protein